MAKTIFERFSFIKISGDNYYDKSITYHIVKRNNKHYLRQRDWYFQGDSPDYQILFELSEEELNYLINEKKLTIWD